MRHDLRLEHGVGVELAAFFEQNMLRPPRLLAVLRQEPGRRPPPGQHHALVVEVHEGPGLVGFKGEGCVRVACDVLAACVDDESLAAALRLLGEPGSLLR